MPCENSLLRQVSSLLRRLPTVESVKFQDDFLMDYNDTLLVSYLAMFTNCSRYDMQEFGYLSGHVHQLLKSMGWKNRIHLKYAACCF
ncbi:hypothetical protein AgCh_010206 [Apium graveolens]